jgi:hypothetical protein
LELEAVAVLIAPALDADEFWGEPHRGVERQRELAHAGPATDVGQDRVPEVFELIAGNGRAVKARSHVVGVDLHLDTGCAGHERGLCEQDDVALGLGELELLELLAGLLSIESELPPAFELALGGERVDQFPSL